MESLTAQIAALQAKRAAAPIRVQTLGNFLAFRQNMAIPAKDWGRDTAIQLFQFLITA